MLILTTSLHAHDGDCLHGSFVPGLPSVVGEISDSIGDMFDDILEATPFHSKSAAIMPEQPSWYSSCSHQIRQWVLVTACRYYRFKERCGSLKYWIVEHLVVTHYHAGAAMHDIGMMPRA